MTSGFLNKPKRKNQKKRSNNRKSKKLKLPRKMCSTSRPMMESMIVIDVELIYDFFFIVIGKQN